MRDQSSPAPLGPLGVFGGSGSSGQFPDGAGDQLGPFGGIAAAPDGQGCRVAFLGSFRVPGLRFLRPLLGPLERRVGRMVLQRLEARVHAR